MTEIWKKIEGTHGMMEVSSLGRIRSLLRIDKTVLKYQQRPVAAWDPYSGKRYDFESVSAAERWFRSRHITSVLKGRRKHVHGWTFAYADELDRGVI